MTFLVVLNVTSLQVLCSSSLESAKGNADKEGITVNNEEKIGNADKEGITVNDEENKGLNEVMEQNMVRVFC